MTFSNALHLLNFRTWLYGGESEIYILKLPKSNRKSQKSLSSVSLEAFHNHEDSSLCGQENAM